MTKTKIALALSPIFIIAVVICVLYFGKSDVDEIREQIIIEMTFLKENAMSYYNQEIEKNRKRNSFDGWEIPEYLLSTKNGNYSADVNNQSIVLHGIGFKIGNDGINKVNVRMVLGPNSILSTVAIN